MTQCFSNSRRLERLLCLLFAVLISATPLYAQSPATTTVADVVYRADGVPAAGTLLISWPAFTARDNYAVAAGSMSLAIGPAGALTVLLVPNEGATPAGTYYKIVFKLNDGTTSTEYWSVPVSSPTNISAIRSSLVPAGQAIQVASRQYVDSTLVHKSGDTMTGPLVLVADPATPAEAANRHYVDTQVAANSGGARQDGIFNVAAYASLQAAVDAANAAGGGKVQVPAETYNGPLILYRNTTLECASPNAVITLPNGANAHVVTLATGASNIAIVGCRVDGNASHQAGNWHGIVGVGVSNVTLDGVEIANTRANGLQLLRNGTTAGSNITLSKVNIHDVGAHAAEFYSVQGLKLIDSTLKSWGTLSSANAAIFFGATYGGNDVRDQSTDVVISGNHFVNGPGRQFAIESGSPNYSQVVKGCSISGNTLDGGGYGGNGISGWFFNCTFNNVMTNGDGSWRSGYELAGNNDSITGGLVDNGAVVLAGFAGGTAGKYRVDGLTLTTVGGAGTAGFYLGGPAGDPVQGISLSDVTCVLYGAGSCLYIGTYGTSGQVNDVKVHGAHLFGNGTAGTNAVRLLAGAGSSDIDIRGVRATGFAYGYVDAAGTNATEVTVTGNDFRGNTVPISHTATGNFRIYNNVQHDGDDTFDFGNLNHGISSVAVDDGAPCSNPTLGFAELGAGGGRSGLVRDPDGTINICIDGISRYQLYRATAGAPAAWAMMPLGTADAGANHDSNQLAWYSSIWSGSAAINDFWAAQVVHGSGANPSSTLHFTHGGSSGPLQVTFNAPTLRLVSGNVGNLQLATLSAERTYTFPDKSGTLAMTSDAVPPARQVTAIAPLTGGGALNADINLGCTTATDAQAGCVSAVDHTAYTSAVANSHTHANKTFLDAITSRSGNTSEAGTTSGTKTTNKQLIFDAAGNIVASSYDAGAAGGGSNDCTDNPAAGAWAPAWTAGHRYCLGAGTYTLSGGQTVGVANVTVACLNRSTVVQMNSAATMFTLSAANFTIENCTLDNSSRAGSSFFAIGTGANYATIQGNLIQNGSANTPWIEHTAGNGLKIRNNVVPTMTGTDFYHANGTGIVDFHVDWNTITSTYGAGTGNTINLEVVAGPGTINFNTFNCGGTTCIWARSGSSTPRYEVIGNQMTANDTLSKFVLLNGSYRSVIANNTLIGNGKFVQGGLFMNDCFGSITSANSIRDLNDGVALSVIDAVGCNVLGNIIEGFSADGTSYITGGGIVIATAASPGPNKMLVEGNQVFYKAGVAASNAVAAISLQCAGAQTCDHVEFNNNKIWGNGATGTSAGYLIKGAAGTTISNTTIRGGQITGVTNGVVVDATITPTNTRIFDVAMDSVTTPYVLGVPTFVHDLTTGIATGSIPANLANGSMLYLTDSNIANPCAAGGSGAILKRLNGVNVCN